MAAQTGIEAALAKIMDVVQKQNEEMSELRQECAQLRHSNTEISQLLRETVMGRRDSTGLAVFTPGGDGSLRSFSPHPLPKLSPAMRYIPPPSPSPQLTVPAMDREIPGFYVIIPAGGAGTRLWPLSRENHPKFLLDIDLSGRSLLQSTWHRLVPLAGSSRMTVVAGPCHSESIQTQLPQLESDNLFTEPGPKDSMAAIGLAAAILLHRDEDAVIGSFAADHMIAGEDAFLNSVTEAVKVAKEGFLVTIGIAPSHPATGFGYVKLGDKLDVPNAPSARLVSAFKEKPDAYTAAKYLSSGNYRWNAGMFVTKASTLMDLVKEYEPELHSDLTRIAKAWEDKTQRETILNEVWPTLEKVAIDNAIAEPAAAEGRVAVIPATFGWDDVGDFSSLAEMLPAEANSPRILGDRNLVVAQQAPGGIVVPGSGRLVACLGVDDLVIVDVPDALMVTTRARAQEVKSLVASCRKAGFKNLM
ncbi:Xanthan biosynthesis protein XanB [Metarhizium brunneum]|uniref:Mannose-1-phosphate guanyltransferase n=1 Tax=Metarhizium brunneum TaxID=500148 RepID=A0A7D5YX49_9HYPO|nr:Xanthan biosynthesis protein XanB [Metarhizium brunneum]